MIILASKSPRRKELLKQIVPSFICVDSQIDESLSLSFSPLRACQDIALRKAVAVSDTHPDDVVIAADTIVVLDKKIYGKPKDKSEAEKMLSSLSGRQHEVITCFVIKKGSKIKEGHVITSVTFESLSKKTIEEYIASGSPMDKAGAYGIQDRDRFPLIASYHGSLDNVIGLPVKEIKAALEEIVRDSAS